MYVTATELLEIKDEVMGLLLRYEARELMPHFGRRAPGAPGSSSARQSILHDDQELTLNDSHVMTLSDGRDLGWTEFGNPDGWPVFGFHGTPGSRLQMGLNEAAACRADVRLIAPDRPGYGLSTSSPVVA